MPVKKAMLVLLLCLSAPVIFLWSWIAEQPSAIKMAWLDSFAGLPDVARKIWKST